jgi:transcription antitermination factor NusA-like protein
MKSPICKKCVIERDLCEVCKKKHEEGTITEADISLARLLYKLEQKQFVKDPSFTRAIDFEKLFLIITHENVGNLVGKGGRVVRLLSKEMGKKVRVINGKDFKTAIQDLMAPARVTGINIVYAPEGEKTKIIVSNQDKYRLISDLETLTKAANELTEKTVLIELR